MIQRLTFWLTPHASSFTQILQNRKTCIKFFFTHNKVLSFIIVELIIYLWIYDDTKRLQRVMSRRENTYEIINENNCYMNYYKKIHHTNMFCTALVYKQVRSIPQYNTGRVQKTMQDYWSIFINYKGFHSIQIYKNNKKCIQRTYQIT